MDWIKNIGDAIKGAMQSARKTLPSIPPILLLCEITNRPGMSAIALTGAIISKMQTKGYETGVADCGMENKDNRFIKIMCEETIKHIKLNARVETVVAPMELSFIGFGGNAGGPVTVTMSNPSVAKFGGIPE